MSDLNPGSRWPTNDRDTTWGLAPGSKPSSNRAADHYYRNERPNPALYKVLAGRHARRLERDLRARRARRVMAIVGVAFLFLAMLIAATGPGR